MYGLFDMLFGCCHKHFSFPITTKRGSAPSSQAAHITGTYVVCLDCGKEFPYDWDQMKVLTTLPKPSGSSLGAERATHAVKVA